MDLASGYSDSTDYGNGYTPLATNAINNNNANYWANQATVALMAQQAQDNVFASGGGFGKQTADYAGAGAAYGRAVQPQMSDNIYGVNGDTWSGMSAGDRATFNKTMGGSSSSSQPVSSNNATTSSNPSVFDTGSNTSYDPNVAYGGGYTGASSLMGTSSGNFNTSGYYNANPDALDAFKNQGGWGISDPTKFAETHLKSAYNNPEDHSIRSGWETTANPNFDAAGYYKANPDAWEAFANSSATDPTAFAEQHLKDAYNNPEDHSIRTGWNSGNSDFDAAGYYAANPDAWHAYAVEGGWGDNANDPTAFAKTHYQSAHDAEGGNWRPFVTDSNLSDIGNTDFSSQNRNIWATGGSAFDDYGQLYDDGTGDSSATGNYDAFKNTTYRDPWIAAIPEKFRTNETVDAMKDLAQQYGWAPAALANVIAMETKNSRIAGQKGINPDSLWNTLTETGQYHGLTQMGRGTFKDAGGRLNGLTYEEYKKASPAQQIKTYGAWIDQGAKIPGSAADLVKGGIGSLPVEDQAAIMMGTQFGPNAKSWVSALGGGNMDVQTHTDQAAELKPWTINAMRDAMAKQMATWPQTQSPWPLK